MMRHCLLNGNALSVDPVGAGDGQPESLHPYAPGEGCS